MNTIFCLPKLEKRGRKLVRVNFYLLRNKQACFSLCDESGEQVKPLIL